MKENHTILLVDKDLELCAALEKYLLRHGYNVIRPGTGEGYVEAVSNHSPAVIVVGSELEDISWNRPAHHTRKFRSSS